MTDQQSPLQSSSPIPVGYMAVDSDGKEYAAGATIQITTDLINVTDPYGYFGPPDTAEKFAPGQTTVLIDGEPVPGPVEVRPV